MRKGQHIVLKHLSGTKRSRTERFAVRDTTELMFGREATCAVRYDSDQDEFVSRRHMKLVRSRSDPVVFFAVDLGSRNGTFINRQRISGPARIQPGDTIQLGAGGPELVFDLVPRRAAGPDRIRSRWRIPRFRRAAVIICVLGMALLVGSAAVVVYGALPMRRWTSRLQRLLHFWNERQVKRAGKKNTPVKTATELLASTVSVVAEWRLLDVESGRLLKQVYIRNESPGKDGAHRPLVAGAGSELPVFALAGDNRIEPVLTTEDDPGNRRVGGSLRGSGLVAGSRHVVLTTRQIVVPWTAEYQWPAGDQAGVVAVFGKGFEIRQTAVIARNQFPRWVPMRADFVLHVSSSPHSVPTQASSTRVAGVIDHLDVGFGSPARWVPAEVVCFSDRADLAAISVGPVDTLPAAALLPGSELRPGEIVMLATSGTDERRSLWSARVRRHIPGLLDRYEVAVDTVGPSSEDQGAPIFDQGGRVIALEAAGDPLGPAHIVALPIRYAASLLESK